eukprot:scaffold123610_cov60-Phaeocystis_antarctica.AAC.2
MQEVAAKLARQCASRLLTPLVLPDRARGGHGISRSVDRWVPGLNGGQSQCASSCSATRVSNSAGRASRESDGLGWRVVGARADTSPTTSSPASSAAPPL